MHPVFPMMAWRVMPGMFAAIARAVIYAAVFAADDKSFRDGHLLTMVVN